MRITRTKQIVKAREFLISACSFARGHWTGGPVVGLPMNIADILLLIDKGDQTKRVLTVTSFAVTKRIPTIRVVDNWSWAVPVAIRQVPSI